MLNLDLLLQMLLNGLMSGGMYALVASGFTLILGVLQVFNFAQGHFYMLGAYVTVGMAAGIGAPYPVAVIAAVAAMALLGALLYTGVIRWTLPAGFFHTLLVTTAFGTIVNQVALLTFGRREVAMPSVLPGATRLGPVAVNNGKLIVVGGALFVMLALYFFMKTKIGVSMRAAAENREVASLQGINPKRIFWATMAVGCGLCGAAGSLIAPVLAVSSSAGTNIMIKAMLVVLVGGTGSMSGALLAAFLIGLAESIAFQYLGQQSLVAIFALVAVLVFFRPGGLLGRPLPIPGE